MCKKLAYLISFVVVLIVADGAPAGLVGHWTFDEGSGTVAAGLSGKGNDGTVMGDATWVAGLMGGSALNFDDSDDIVVIDDDPSLDIEDALTISLWVNTSNVVAPNHMVTKQPSGTAPDNYPGNYEFRVKDNTIQFLHQTSESTDYSLYISTSLITAGQWHHAAVSIVEGGFVEFYLDGVPAGSVAQSGTFGVLNDDSLRIGGRKDNHFFNGMLDDVYIYDRALTPNQIEGLSKGIEPDFSKAEQPSVPDDAVYENTWANLAWTPGDSAVSHNVYFGTNFDDVNQGGEGAFAGNTLSTFQVIGFPGFPAAEGLQPGTTYYWRIDEVNESDPNSPWKGDVWSFSVPPKTAYDPDPADGAEFVDPNAIFTWTGGFAAKLHTVYMGTNFDYVNNAAGGIPLGSTSYSPGTLESEKVYYWRVDEFDPPTTYKGDIWSFTTPDAVGNPQPANGAVDAQILTTLGWTPADTAASSDLYFGADADAVKNATAASPEYIGNKALGSESHDPGELSLGASYHWRVDAVYPDKTVKGLLWSFTAADFIGVDDFESYNDIDPPDPNSNRIFDKWIDGFGTTTNGALVGNDLPPYAEQTVVHGGAQALVYRYDNNLKTSEATLTLVYPRDWTAEGVTKLALWFRGASANAAERMFVALNGNAVVYHDDASATQMTGWNEWVMDLTAFADVDLTNVNTLTVGFATKNSPAAGGTGTMYFDAIRLIR
ncbi:MAG: LamG domain-containing protein [Phycisphaerae bacterium]|nr:LamG domain-containing protein [Phycisphaerae bacterium]